MKDFDPFLLKIVQNSKSDQFSFFDYLYSMNKGPEEALIYSRLFFPEFIIVENYIFLAENYDKSYFDEVMLEYGESKIESTINTTYLYDLVGGKPEYKNDVWETLGKVLCETWEYKLKVLFPDKLFIVEFSWYSDLDDPGVTLYQRKKN